MIKIFKSNKLTTLFLFIICIFFVINPKLCASSCLNAISVWGLKVLPMLFPFFILTRLILNLTTFKPNFMDKFFNKAYNAPNGSFLVFFLSILAGYPMGAKLICSMYESRQISTSQAKSMLSFCSVSGPMFILGTVGYSIFNNHMVGLVVLISNILASLINGFFYKNKDILNKQELTYSGKNTSLSDIVYNSLISVLMVGAYIVISFIFIDLIKKINAFTLLETLLHTDLSILEATFTGFIEITRGSIEICSTNINIVFKAILTSGIIAFGGISVFMQSLGFLNSLNIKPKYIFLQKVTQSIICLLISIPFSFMLL